MQAGPGELPIVGFQEEDAEFVRPVVELTITRPFRDQAFKTAVRLAYENRCALTGLQLINGGGRPEVQAAHIKPVSENGPDTIRNGLALSGTLHWLFDRGLISVSDEYRILIAEKKVPDQIRSMLNTNGEIIRPRDPNLRPSVHFLQFHRANIFKG